MNADDVIGRPGRERIPHLVGMVAAARVLSLELGRIVVEDAQTFLDENRLATFLGIDVVAARRASAVLLASHVLLARRLGEMCDAHAKLWLAAAERSEEAAAAPDAARAGAGADHDEPAPRASSDSKPCQG